MSAILAVAVLVAATPTLANDSTAALGAGGLNLVRNQEIDLLSEDLHISADEVRVTYRFRNGADHAVTYLVAFPLPVIDASTPEEASFVLPDPGSDNFVDFAVTVDGKPVTPAIDQHAFALGVDRSDVLRAHHIPLDPVADGVAEAIARLPAAAQGELNRLGLTFVDPLNVQAAWVLRTTFYWEETFPPGREVVVEHRYKPVVGRSLFGPDKLADAGIRARYCLDPGFLAAARGDLDRRAGSENPYLEEERISYILTTANNWASPIRSFRAVVDTGEADALAGFCGAGTVRRISPTEVEMTATDFTPEHELEVLVLRPKP
jgi:hypothetical protein